MTEAAADPARAELEAVLRRLEDEKTALIATLEEADARQFDVADDEGVSVKYALDRTVDDVNLYYGRLAASALNLPQPPYMTPSDFGSQREGAMSLQHAHRQFTNLLHDVLPADLEKSSSDSDLGSFTLRQVLEMATAHYSMRAQQVRRLAGRPIDSLKE